MMVTLGASEAIFLSDSVALALPSTQARSATAKHYKCLWVDPPIFDTRFLTAKRKLQCT